MRVQDERGRAVVKLKKRFMMESEGIVIGRIDMASDDAETQLIEVKRKAKDMANEINQLEKR